MTAQRFADTIGTDRRPWPLELDGEVAPSAPAITVERARALAELIARIHGVELASAEPHREGRFVLVRLTVTAADMTDAVDRACAFLHSSAVAAGLSPLVLVAARLAR